MADNVPLSNCLQKILESKVLENTAPGNNSIRLKESSARMNVQITGVVPSSITTIKMGKVSHLSCLKDGNWKQICDYLLIAQINGNDYAIFIELKKTLTRENKPKEQLRRSLPLLDYLLSVCKVEFGNVPEVLIKYVIIAEKLNERLDKQRTRVRPFSPVTKENYKTMEILKFITPKIGITELAVG